MSPLYLKWHNVASSDFSVHSSTEPCAHRSYIPPAWQGQWLPHPHVHASQWIMLYLYTTCQGQGRGGYDLFWEVMCHPFFKSFSSPRSFFCLLLDNTPPLPESIRSTICLALLSPRLWTLKLCRRVWRQTFRYYVRGGGSFDNLETSVKLLFGCERLVSSLVWVG